MSKLFFYSSVLFLLFSCKTKKLETRDFQKEGFSSATIIKYEVESCGYLIRLADDQLLMPDSLPKAFEKNNLDVWIKFQFLKKQAPSVCMAGKNIKLIEIAERKK
jgi:hypothetical protein